MMQCIIIDDEPLARALLEGYVEKTPELTCCGSFGSASEALALLRQGGIDIAFLDIQMPELGGMELARLIPPTTKVVFTTAFSEYAVEGYKVGAAGYLMKPIAYADFLATISRIEEQKAHTAAEGQKAEGAEGVQRADADSIFVKSDYKILRVRLDDIRFIEGLKDYVKIYLTSQPKPILSLMSMRGLEDFLPEPQFQRVHRSYIVNMNLVNIIERGTIVFEMEGLRGLEHKYIPVSESYKERMQQYINERLLQR